MPTTEIHPNKTKNLIIVVAISATITLIGLVVLWKGDHLVEKFVGVIAIILFGGGGTNRIWRILRRRVFITLTPNHIEQHYPDGVAYIPWGDIAKIGIVSMHSNKLVGIFFKNYDSYLGKMSPSLAKYIGQTKPISNFVSGMTSSYHVPDSYSAAEDESAREIMNLYREMNWTRRQFGYDILLSWSEIDRSAVDFVKLLEQYRMAAET